MLGFPVMPALFLVAATGMVLNALITDPVNTGITFAIILAGIPVYLIWFRRGTSRCGGVTGAYRSGSDGLTSLRRGEITFVVGSRGASVPVCPLNYRFISLSLKSLRFPSRSASCPFWAVWQ